MTTSTATAPGTAPTTPAPDSPPVVDHLRFLRKHEHLSPAFGNDGFARKAEAFARVFGTPKFLAAQTAFVVVWIVINLTGVAKFDAYPFILLNLAFSLQAAYAAPLILLAQTRQAERDKALADADTVEARLRTVPGIRHVEPFWHLGEPSDPWILTLTIIDGRLFALAPEGFAGGMSRCEAGLYFIEWVESFLEALQISFHP